FALHAYRHFDAFTAAGQPAWAEAVGMDGEAFAALLAEPATRDGHRTSNLVCNKNLSSSY
ncbi:MAG: hypothetical protein ACK4Z9_02840, partial [Thermodesulfovibrionales bacterium]